MLGRYGGFRLPLVSGWGQNTLIKSVQYGTLTFAGTGTGTATITAVATQNSFVIFEGVTCNTGSSNPVFTHARVDLTNATTVTGTGFSDAAVRTVAFCVVELQPGLLRQNQQGTVTIADLASSGTATITSSNITKTVLIWGGDQVDTGDDRSAGYNTLTNATTVTYARAGTAGIAVSAFTALEFL